MIGGDSMPTEKENRQHCCCFIGHRPKYLDISEEKMRQWLAIRIDKAIRDGYTTFITSCARGVSIWAGEIVLQKKAEHPELRLTAAIPWPGYADDWEQEWQDKYKNLLSRADLAVNVSDHFHKDAIRQRNKWMVDHCNRLIAYLIVPGSETFNTIDYALHQGLELYINTY